MWDICGHPLELTQLTSNLHKKSFIVQVTVSVILHALDVHFLLC